MQIPSLLQAPSSILRFRVAILLSVFHFQLTYYSFSHLHIVARTTSEHLPHFGTVTLLFFMQTENILCGCRIFI